VPAENSERLSFGRFVCRGRKLRSPQQDNGGTIRTRGILANRAKGRQLARCGVPISNACDIVPLCTRACILFLHAGSTPLSFSLSRSLSFPLAPRNYLCPILYARGTHVDCCARPVAAYLSLPDAALSVMFTNTAKATIPPWLPRFSLPRFSPASQLPGIWGKKLRRA
jgi:hypothetical protein